MLCARKLGSSEPVTMMTGNLAPATFSAFCTSVPDTPGICVSSSRQSGSSKCQDFRNSPGGKGAGTDTGGAQGADHSILHRKIVVEYCNHKDSRYATTACI